MIALDATARDTSDSLIAPIPSCIILTFTSLLESFKRDDDNASNEP